MTYEAIKQQFNNEKTYTGVVQLRQDSDVIWSKSYGYRQVADQLPNTINTRFGIASGTKLLTGVAVCQLVEQGKIQFESRLQDVLDFEFPNFDTNVTVYHLLTHTSGIPDYFDEETMDDFGALWIDRPTYTIHSPKDVLPLFQNQPMKFPPETRFHYNNAGFILLGLIIEAVSGQSYTEYVTDNILKPANMTHSGFFSMDRLPANTALGYVNYGEDNPQTNIFQIPYVGSSDGGVFVTASDVGHFWDALLGNTLLSPEMTQQMLKIHVKENDDPADDTHYGLGIWLQAQDNQPTAYYGVGTDPGVAFASAYIPTKNIDITLISNTETEEFWQLFKTALDNLI